MTATVYPGDRVRDPIDNTIRTVASVTGSTVYLTDGGLMGLDEIDSVWLPSESPSDAEALIAILDRTIATLEVIRRELLDKPEDASLRSLSLIHLSTTLTSEIINA